MDILGFQKLTLIDYPGKVACTIFTGGCNFRCPFCHNASLVLVDENEPRIDKSEILDYLSRRQKVLDGVCITGGEPLMHAETLELIREIHDMGYSVKLDTNGSYPERLKQAVNEGIVDYVAMDIKNSPETYAATIGLSQYDLSRVQESIDFLMSSNIDFEFRTTVMREYHTLEEMLSIASWIKGAPRYYLQAFTDSGDLLEGGMSAYSSEEMQMLCEKLRQLIPGCRLREIK